jgi:hypothetical protein
MTFENMGLSMFVLVLDVELACYLSKNKSIPNNKGRKVSVVGSSNTFFFGFIRPSNTKLPTHAISKFKKRPPPRAGSRSDPRAGPWE